MTPRKSTQTLTPYRLTEAVNLAVKCALTIPPKPLQAPPTGVFQRPPVTPSVPGYPPVANQPLTAPMQQGRGRPVGVTSPTTAQPNQAAMMPQPSPVAQMAGQSSTQPQKGFGNTPVSSTQSAKGSHSPSSTKGAAHMKTKKSNAAMGYGMTPSPKPAPMPAPAMAGAMPMKPMPIMTPMSSTGPMSSMSSMMSKFSSAELAMQKAALIGTLAGGGLGALTAGPGNRNEGFHRGAGRFTGLARGAGIGGLAGAGLGGGLGAGLGGLAAYLSGNKGPALVDAAGMGGLAGAGIGGAAGLGIGGAKGWQTVGDYMGPASYDPENTKPDRGLAKEKEESKHDKKKTEKKSNAPGAAISLAASLLNDSLGGGSIEAARAYSDKRPSVERSGRYLHGMHRGLYAGRASGLGGVLGALAGGGLGAGAGLGLGALTGNPDMQGIGAASGGLMGAGLGGSLGAYHGGRLGLNLTEDKEDKERKAEKPEKKKG